MSAQWTDSDGTVTSLGYDASDQLTSEVRDNSHSTGYSLGYTYDHNSNRLTKVVGTGGSAVTTTNTYGTHDQLLTSGSKSYGYDGNGNCTSVTVGSNVTSISYDYENRVVGITYPSSATNSFAYNGDDMRMQKVDSAGTFNYVCDGTAPASAVLKDGSAIYTPGLSERRSSTSKFYHGDNLGSTRGITNSSQTVTDASLFDAFGNTVSRTGTTPTPFGFVGQGQYQTDNDSGLMLLGERYYDASVGRFISSDPAKAGDNWYAYCDNNPLTKLDPTGLDDWTVVYGGDEGVAQWKFVYELTRPSGPHVTELIQPSKAELLNALLNADQFYFWGHGAGSGTIWANNKEIVSTAEVIAVAKKRQRLGKPKLKWIELHACDTTDSAYAVNAWLQLGDEVGGYPGVTAQAWPPHVNPIHWYDGPINYDPGVPDEKGRQKQLKKQKH